MVTEVPFNRPDEEEPLEPLRLEHFYLALMILGVGLFLSALVFIAEIIIKRRGQRERKRIVKVAS